MTSSPEHVSDLNVVLLTRTVIYCVIWPIIIILGIFGNILSLIVIRKTETSSTSSKFLTSLAVADTMNLIVKGAQMVFTWGEIFWPHLYLTWKLSTFSILMLSFLPERISKCITIAIVCDRVVAVVAPLRYKILCRPKRITAIIVLVFAVTATTTLPTIVEFVMFQFSINENRTMHTDIGKEYRVHVSQKSQSTLKTIHVLVNFFIFDCIPIPFVFVGNIIIILSLRKRNILASTTSEVQRQRKQRERQLTKLLLTISMVFVLLTCPSAVYRLFIAAGMTPPNTTIATLVGSTNQTLSLTNSAINFVVYAVMNTKYREGYVAIICRCRRNNGIEDTTEMKQSAELQN